ncbi:TetR/AcrR family transcriptional regulator [Xanthovirga aplysinae]|uniref:TetR/AcrR family transcriptional regulator n=1 Tax=Xanthovirga aplysinae TaxID=2529853 RepID=UPI0012BBAD51|nr:TetR/AcrR family transcriptional regulator [Xanthovirga aplysinae]MTI29453.1 TetR/AcrR family transcriptional regulator [Xanthovirga aplysinae]
MPSKSAYTKKYILEKVAPVFNQKGYVGTSMADITQVTGLTKGAVYGNFENKEELALEAFNHNARILFGDIGKKMQQHTSPIAQLKALTEFYRNYSDYSTVLGGCPILNIAVDSKHQNSILTQRVKQIILKLKKSIETIIEKGIDCHEIKENIDPEKYAGRIFAWIEGAAFMTSTMNDSTYLSDMMDHVDKMIELELKK